MKRELALGFLLAACGPHGDSPTLGERLQGNWFCHRSYPDQGFLRTDDAGMEIIRTSIKYNYNISWECDSTGPCPGQPPATIGDYFEGIFTDLGDSLALMDATEPTSFRDVAPNAFSFRANGHLFPMQRR